MAVDLVEKKKSKRWWYIGSILIIAIGVFIITWVNNNKTIYIPLSEAITLSQEKIFSEAEVGYATMTLIVADDVKDKTVKDIDDKDVALKGKQEIYVSINYLTIKDLKDLGFQFPYLYKQVSGDGIDWGNIVAMLLPIAIVCGLVYVLMFTDIIVGKTDKFKSNKDNKVTFADIGGVSNAKDELREAVNFLLDREYLNKLGAKIPKGILLTGSPGCGKTMLARAIANEAKVDFFYSTASQFQSYWFGLTAQKIKKLFKQAKSKPSIIFIDEFESIAQKRGFRGSDISKDNEITINQLLAEMDGFDKNTNLLVIAATNHPEVLDSAVLRPGRFDRKIVVNVPTYKDRCEILSIHIRNKPLAEDVKIDVIAKQTSGMSGADLAAIFNEASIIAGIAHKEKIDMADIGNAIDKVISGIERKGFIMTDEEKRIVAYHEAGHALVASLLPNCDKVQRVSILPHGNAGGFTRLASDKENILLSKSKVLDYISMMFGGRAAEEIIIGDISSGAQNDIQQANSMAKEMVISYGMGKSFGLRSWNVNEGISNESQKIIESDIKLIIDECYDKSKEIILNNKEKLDKIAQNLIEYEILDSEVVEKIINE